MKNKFNSGVTLLEILLASLIFVVSVAGIFATLNAVRTPVKNKTNALSAAVFGKRVLEALRSSVNNGGTYPFYNACTGGLNPCPDFSLSYGIHQISVATLSWADLNWP
jgi:Tfp pilus assembly protein PilV